MSLRKHVLFTLASETCAEFLVQHWTPSLLGGCSARLVACF